MHRTYVFWYEVTGCMVTCNVTTEQRCKYVHQYMMYIHQYMMYTHQYMMYVHQYMMYIHH